MHTVHRLQVKGKPSDDAVICTPTATYQLRSISLSNSLILFEPPAVSSASTSSSVEEVSPPELQVQDTLHEILELLPIVPRVVRIEKILKDSAWEGISPFPSVSTAVTKSNKCVIANVSLRGVCSRKHENDIHELNYAPSSRLQMSNWIKVCETKMSLRLTVSNSLSFRTDL